MGYSDRVETKAAELEEARNQKLEKEKEEHNLIDQACQEKQQLQQITREK